MDRQKIHDIEHRQLVIMNSLIREELDEATERALNQLPVQTTFEVEDLLLALGEIKASRRYINAAIAMLSRKIAKRGQVLVCIPNIDVDQLTGSIVRNYEYQIVDLELEEYYEGGK